MTYEENQELTELALDFIAEAIRQAEPPLFDELPEPEAIRERANMIVGELRNAWLPQFGAHIASPFRHPRVPPKPESE